MAGLPTNPSLVSSPPPRPFIFPNNVLPSSLSKPTSQKSPISIHFHNPTSQNQNPSIISPPNFTITQIPVLPQPQTVAEKVKTLNSEFKSLPKPIDRVKRLLHYADLLPPSKHSLRIQELRVKGCTAEIWLEVKMELNGSLRFEIESDSEITKGFCYCLLWLLDGAKMDEVISVKSDDLREMNIGLPIRGNSRINTWHNVLFSMQKRTKALADEQSRFCCN